MAIKNGFDKKEFQNQVEQLEEQFSKMGNNKLKNNTKIKDPRTRTG